MRATMVTVFAIVCVLAGACPAGESTFKPLEFPGGDTESRTGMWLCADLGKTEDILPLKTRLYATKESVTGGVALKCVFEPGSKATLNWENGKYPDGTAGLTLYAKASRAIKLNVGRATAEAGTEWKKIDLSWEALQTTKDKRDLGWLLVFSVQGPIKERTWLILDRIGTEGPRFDPSPTIDATAGPDEAISSKDILYGAENLAKTLQRAKGKKPFKIYAFGDSITMGAQMYRGTWGVDAKGGGIRFLWHNHIARLWEEHFGYKGITVLHDGVPGGITNAHLKKIEQFVKDATADDVIVIAASTAPAEYKKPMLQMIATAKKHTDQIILMSPPTGSFVVGASDVMTRNLKELVAEEKVAAADITRLCLYRGEKYGWAGEGNEWHPTYTLSLTMGDMIAPLLTGAEVVWPESKKDAAPPAAK